MRRTRRISSGPQARSATSGDKKNRFVLDEGIGATRNVEEGKTDSSRITTRLLDETMGFLKALSDAPSIFEESFAERERERKREKK